MLAKSNSEFIEFLQLFERDLIGAVFIIATVGAFISFIVLVVSITRTWNNLALARMNQRLVQDLLAKGYSVDDIERLAYGGQAWSYQLRKMIGSARDQVANMVNRRTGENQPVPPYKQTA